MRPEVQEQAEVQTHPPEKHPELHAEGECPKDIWLVAGLLATCSLPGTHATCKSRPRQMLSHRWQQQRQT